MFSHLLSDDRRKQNDSSKDVTMQTCKLEIMEKDNIVKKPQVEAIPLERALELDEHPPNWGERVHRAPLHNNLRRFRQ